MKFPSIKMTPDKAAKILKDDPKLLDAFEESYKKAMQKLPNDCPPSVHVGYESDVDMAEAQPHQPDIITDQIQEAYDLESIKRRIVDELVAMTECNTVLLPAHKENTAVQISELEDIPREYRPQLAGNIVCRDIKDEDATNILLLYLKRMKKAGKNRQAFRDYYVHFRHGMDILDLDPFVYELLGRNANSMERWFPRIKQAAEAEGFFKIPETQIVRVPLPILQMTRLDYGSLNQTTREIVNDWCKKVFTIDPKKAYFVKTGVFSYKFDFRNQKIEGEELDDLGEYFLFISNMAIVLESPLNNKEGVGRYGAATTRTWVLREFIKDKENNPCIYHGMPLHTEYRVFVDFSTNEVLGITPYWREDIMESRFAQDNDIHDRHDYVIYKAHKEKLYARYKENEEKVKEHVKRMLPAANFRFMPQQWSIDIMQNGDDFWLIDMATADTSALADCVPAGLLHKQNELPLGEDWQ